MTISDESGALRDGEFPLEEGDELLYRQIHPSWVHDGKVSSQAFWPTEKDKGELSTSRSSKVSAKEAYDYHVETMSLQSDGAYAVSVAEVAGAGLVAVDDSATSTELPPGHAFIDFKPVTSTNQRKRLGGTLRDCAEPRGWQYKPTASD